MDERKHSELSTLRFYVDMALRRGLSQKSYAIAVVDDFVVSVSAEDCALNMRTGGGKSKLEFQVVLPSDSADEIEHKFHQNMKKLFGYLRGESGHFPLLLRRSMIAALPEALRDECQAELLRDEGFLMVPIPTAAGADAGQVHEEYADVARACGALRADDGRITSADGLTELRSAQKELIELIAASTAELVVVEQAIADKAGGIK